MPKRAYIRETHRLHIVESYKKHQKTYDSKSTSQEIEWTFFWSFEKYLPKKPCDIKDQEDFQPITEIPNCTIKFIKHKEFKTEVQKHINSKKLHDITLRQVKYKRDI